MKKAILLLFVLSWAFQFCNAQNNIILHFNQLVDDAQLIKNDPYTSTAGYAYKVTRLEYYISNIRIKHSGGIETLIPNYYILMNAFTDSEFDLGSYAIGDIESLSFSLGVDEPTNHLDPSSYPAGNPLGNHSPSMHWGWSAGYRFIAYEGFADNGTNTFENLFQVHSLGDVNYSDVTLNMTGHAASDGKTYLFIDANYNKLLENVDVSSGVISHEEGNEAAKVMSNMKTKVFSPSTTTNAQDIETIDWRIAPNPATDFLNVRLPNDLPADTELVISDIHGRVVQRNNIISNNNISLQLSNGIYMASLVHGERLLATQKLVVLK